ncbi:MAG: DNA repair protein RecN [Angelakisella sp.]|nr:DNA repair protein RecN [Angelakisella sp.]
MLSQLYIENIAVIRQATIDFQKGFHVFTGETGAGKTILISAINAVLGGRTFKEIIRTGESRARVSALFTGIPASLAEKIGELGYPLEDGQLLVQREIDLTGKGQCRLDGRPATAAMLREVCSLLIDIHGQHDNQELLSAEKHLGFLDSFGAYRKELEDYAKAYAQRMACADRLEKLQMDESYKLQRMDILQFQLKEIGDARLTDGEEEQLTEQQKRIKNAERITESLGTIYTLLNGDGEELRGVLEALEEISTELDTAAKYLPDFTQYGDKLNDAYYMLEELGSTARDTLEDADFDPRQLDTIESRLDTIYRLKKKYGGSIAEILAYYDKISEEYNTLELSDEMVEQLRGELERAEQDLRQAAKALTARRLETAGEFVRRVEAELAYLDMGGVRFSISRKEKAFGPNGADEMEFLICTNAGEETRPLAKIASGGELARIMLAIKNVLAEKDDIGTIIFDEVDTGVSGRAAQKIGQKLAEVARHRQVICVTHLAPVAACAAHHYRIYKTVEEGRTFTRVEELGHEDRVRELARIMVGDHITESALQSAGEMLAARA